MKGTQEEEERGEEGAWPGQTGVHSEYGGLVLSADSALGILGVHEPRGAALGLRVPFLLHHVPLETQTRGVKVIHLLKIQV